MEVIDGSNGKRVGYLSDIKLNMENGMLESIIVVEGKRRLFAKLFSLLHRIEIYKENIMMFGEDVIVVKTY